MQCQTFWSRTHLPLLLQSPGQPSVNTWRTCQRAKQIRDGEQGVESRWGRRRERGEEEFRLDRGKKRWKKVIKDSLEWTYSTITITLTGLGMWWRVWRDSVVSHEFQEHVQLRLKEVKWMESKKGEKNCWAVHEKLTGQWKRTKGMVSQICILYIKRGCSSKLIWSGLQLLRVSQKFLHTSGSLCKITKCLGYKDLYLW